MGNVTRADSRGICRNTEKGRWEKRKQARKKEKETKETKKQTKKQNHISQ